MKSPNRKRNGPRYTASWWSSLVMAEKAIFDQLDAIPCACW